MSLPNFSQLTSPKYLFDPLPGSNFEFSSLLIGLFLSLIIISFVTKKYLIKDKLLKKLSKKNLRHLGVIGLVGLILVGARLQNMPYLSMRFLLIIIGILIITNLIRLSLIYQRTYPEKTNQLLAKKDENKYLPKRKK